MSSGARNVLYAAVLFGTTGTTQALGPDEAHPLAVGSLRIVIGAIGLVAVARGDLRRVTAGGGWRWLALAALGVACYQVSFFGGVRLAGVGVGTLVTIGSAPVFTGLAAWLINRHRPDRVWYPATAVAIAGLALIAGPGTSARGPGVVLALAAGAGYAIFSIGSERLIQAAGPTATMAAVFAGGAVLLAPLLATSDLGWVATVPGVTAAVWLGLGATTLAYVFYGRGLAVTPATSVATLVLAEPLTAGVLSVVVLREPVTVPAVVGAALIGTGLAFLARRSSDGYRAFTGVG